MCYFNGGERKIPPYPLSHANMHSKAARKIFPSPLSKLKEGQAWAHANEIISSSPSGAPEEGDDQELQDRQTEALLFPVSN